MNLLLGTEPLSLASTRGRTRTASFEKLQGEPSLLEAMSSCWEHSSLGSLGGVAALQLSQQWDSEAPRRLPFQGGRGEGPKDPRGEGLSCLLSVKTGMFSVERGCQVSLERFGPSSPRVVLWAGQTQGFCPHSWCCPLRGHWHRRFEYLCS